MSSMNLAERLFATSATKNLFAQMFPKETTTGDIYTDAQMDWLCDAISARLAKAARNRVETIHEVQGSFPK